MKKLNDDMTKDFNAHNLDFLLHASIGYTIIEPDDEGTIKDYIDTADKSMYAEKEKYHKLIDGIRE